MRGKKRMRAHEGASIPRFRQKYTKGVIVDFAIVIRLRRSTRVGTADRFPAQHTQVGFPR